MAWAITRSKLLYYNPGDSRVNMSVLKLILDNGLLRFGRHQIVCCNNSSFNRLNTVHISY